MGRHDPVLRAAARCLFWASVWLAVVLIAVKACYLGVPARSGWSAALEYLRSVAAISYVDTVFAALAWACGRATLALAGNRPRLVRAVPAAFVALAAGSCLYAVATVILFGTFGGFLTYPLLMLVGSVRMFSSSAAAYLTPDVIVLLASAPLAYLVLLRLSLRIASGEHHGRWPRRLVACTALAAWVLLGQHAFAAAWATRQEHRIAENPHWVMITSLVDSVAGPEPIRIDGQVSASDLQDFERLGATAAPKATVETSPFPPPDAKASVVARRPNIILIVLESVAARWTSLYGALYDTTPSLHARAERSLVFENFYAHTGRSSNSLAAILLSVYPELAFRDFTEEHPRVVGTSLASVFRDEGYRTAFVTPSDLAWANWDDFLAGRGFDELRDYQDLPCTAPLSSWGVEDRCLVDDLIRFLERTPTSPFFFMGWTQQTHHPYEPTPGVPLLDFPVESIPDAYNLNRYLNVLHETDRQLGRLFEALDRAQLDRDTLVVITGDHGQAFGYPHHSYMQGRTVYEEDVRVPLMIWSPTRYPSAQRPAVIGSHVDLAPTLVGLADLTPAPDWQGRSLFDQTRSPRAYFYVADDRFTLAVREEGWKYIFDLRDGVEELYDLATDPLELRNLAAIEPARSARLRQRLIAWTEANRRRYDPPQAGLWQGPPGSAGG